jgi:CRISPR-associated protein Csb2
MPVRSGRTEKKTLVFDAFLRLDPHDELLVVWPHMQLSAPEKDLLDHLLERMGYLGRAESWVTCRMLDDWSELPNCGPRTSAESWGRGMDLEPVDLPVAVPPEEYSRWRAEEIQTLGLEKPRLKKEKALAATLPVDLLDALRLDTGDTRAVGWSRVPGTRMTSYLRPRDCFSVNRSEPRSRVVFRRRITSARLALVGKPLPLLEDALKIGEAVRAAAMHHAERLDHVDGIPTALSGHKMEEDPPHQHAFYLPEDLDDDGRIDHVTVHAPAGLGQGAIEALNRIERLWESRGAEWRVLLETYGSAEELGRHPYLIPSRTWQSVTPYLHPWFRKKSFSVEDQIRREIAARGLPEPELTPLTTVKIHGRDRRPVHFHRFRRRTGLTQPDTRGSFWRLTFSRTVAGPMALGFGCHFGLGMFAALDR